MAAKTLPSIPAIPGNISSDLFAVLSAIKTQLDYAQENPSSGTTNAVDQAQLEAAVANAVTGITKGGNGKTYLLFITGGKTNAVYDTSGANPLPAPTAFGCELYENGSLVTPGSYAWSVPASNSLLSGSSATATFTPTLASTFDANKGDNRVLLTATYAGQTVKAVQPIAITQQVSGSSPDMTTPNAIDNLEVTGGVLYNFLTWGINPTNTDIDHIDVYRAATDDRTAAAVIGTTKARVYADYIPDGVGGTYYYWLRAVSKTGVVGDWNLISGVVSSAGTSATPLGIGDSQVGTISATKILAATLSAISANLGTVTAGTIQSADETFKIDLANKSITVAGTGGVAAADYTIMQNGQLQFWKWTGSTHQQGQSLNTIESGQADNGALVELKKWYPAIPKILISPNDTPVYNKDYASQSQKLQIRAENVAISGGGVVTFNAVARLVLAGSNPSIVVTDSYTGSSDTDTTATRTTAANTTKIDCNVSFSSKRGTGTVPNFYYRKVDARIAYRTSPSGSWNYTSWVTTNINNDFNTYTTSLTTGDIASGTYDFYVEFAAADRGSTFTNGGIDYQYGDDVTLTIGQQSTIQGGVVSGVNSGSGTYTFSTFTPPSGYTSGDVYQVDYTFNYDFYQTSRYSGSGGVTVYAYKDGTVLRRLGNTGSTLTASGTTNNVSHPVTTDAYGYLWGESPQDSTPGSSYAYSASSLTMSHAFSVTGQYSRNESYFRLISATAVVKTRKAANNSTTPENVFSLISYSLTLLSAEVIDTSGTLNYVAIG